MIQPMVTGFGKRTSLTTDGPKNVSDEFAAITQRTSDQQPQRPFFSAERQASSR